MNKWQCLVVAVIALIIGGVLGFLYRGVSVRQSESLRMTSLRDMRHKIYKTTSPSSIAYGIVYGNEKELRLDTFEPTVGENYILLSFVGGFGAPDSKFQLNGNGELHAFTDTTNELVITIPREICKEMFSKVITNGILDYCDGVIDLKKDLLRPHLIGMVTDNPTTLVNISLPKFGIHKQISVYMPEMELENYPDIKEFQLVVDLRKDISKFLPKGYLR